MKVILFLTLLIIDAFAAITDDSNSTRINGQTPSFLMGTWYLSGKISNYDPPSLKCCMPYGTITFTPDTANASQAHMTSNVWAGESCSALGINSNYNMTIALPWNQSYNELYFDKNTVNFQGIRFSVQVLVAYANWSNGTQQVETNFYMDYSNVLNGDDCGITISKDTSPDNHNVSNNRITGDTPAFLIGEWYLSGKISNYDPPRLQCCMPYGTITFTPDTANASQAHMTSNVWAGERCSALGINSNYNMTIALPWNQSYNELYFDKNTVNFQGIRFSVQVLVAYANWSNGTQQVETNFYMDYSDVLNGDDCGITISKDTSPVALRY